MKIDLTDYDTIHISDGNYDGPDGCLLKGDRFRVVAPSVHSHTLAKGEFVAEEIQYEGIHMLFRSVDGVIVSD